MNKPVNILFNSVCQKERQPVALHPTCIMKKKHLILALTLLMSGLAMAQSNYRTALGLRLNGGAGVTVRHFINSKSSLEGILYTRWGGVNLTGLYAVNFPVFNEPGFNFYVGGGGHIGVWDRDNNPWWDDDKRYNDNRLVVGLDGQIGLEYTFSPIPLNLSIDWKPAVNFIGVSNFWGSDLALSVRYAFK